MSEQSSPSLNEVQAAFAQWRVRGTPKRTPQVLREQAVSLLATHRISDVMQALKLDHRRLSRWRAALAAAPSSAAPSEFIELPAAVIAPAALATSAPASVALTLTRHSGEGHAVSIVGELPAEHWHWALKLLQEARL